MATLTPQNKNTPVDCLLSMEISGIQMSTTNKTDMEKRSSRLNATSPSIRISTPIDSKSDCESPNANSPVVYKPPSTTGKLFKPTPYPRHSGIFSPSSEETVEHALDGKQIELVTDPYLVLHSIANVNRTLQNRIEALRLRLSYQSKHNDEEKRHIELQNTNTLQAKDAEIEGLLKSLEDKDREIDELVGERRMKDRTIDEKVKEIDNLKLLVQQTENYTDKLQKQMDRLKDEKRALESDAVYRKQKEEIIRLRHELKTLHSNIQTMEYDIVRAKGIIHAQGVKIRGLERDNAELASTFKDQLDRATTSIRQEVGRMRDIMGTQWEEMKGFCEQNKDMHSDLTFIKDHLINQSAEMASFQNRVSTGATSSQFPTRSNKSPRKCATNVTKSAKGAQASPVATSSRLSNSESQYGGNTASSKELPVISQSGKSLASRVNPAWRHPSGASKGSQKKH